MAGAIPCMLFVCGFYYLAPSFHIISPHPTPVVSRVFLIDSSAALSYPPVPGSLEKRTSFGRGFGWFCELRRLCFMEGSFRDVQCIPAIVSTSCPGAHEPRGISSSLHIHIHCWSVCLAMEDHTRTPSKVKQAADQILFSSCHAPRA